MRSFISIVTQSFKMSIQNIISNKMRSFLTMLGIIIGVASVIGLMTIVQGATNSVMGEFDALGTGSISLSAYGTAIKRGLSLTEVNGLRDIKGVKKVLPETNFKGSVAFEENVYKKVTVNGETSEFFTTKEIKLGRGILESECGGDTMVCAVDETFVKKVLIGHTAVGSKIIVNGYTYTVIGVIKNSDNMMGGLYDTSKSDGNVYIPFENALTMQNISNITSLLIYIEDGEKADVVQARLRTYLDKIFGKAEDAYFLISMDSLMDTMNKVMGMMSGLLAGIASIALVVGGIGIMNMMLVSVTERTKEIGLRKALGAEPARIQLQFLIESIVLSLVGGVIGIVVGLGIAAIGAAIMKTDFAIMASAIYIGVGFSIGVGVLFGWAPAKKASELNPIDALRSE